MKLFILLTLFVSSMYCRSLGQKLPIIDSNNYYNYYSNGSDLSTNTIHTRWLTYLEITPILLEELKNAGYQDVLDNQLYQLANKQMIILPAYCYNEDFGFAYCQGHAAIPKKEHRSSPSRLMEASGNEYMQRYYHSKSESGSFIIKKLPLNIFTLREDCYWYQYTGSTVDDEMLITKDIAINILRQDIRARIVKAPKIKN